MNHGFGKAVNMGPGAVTHAVFIAAHIDHITGPGGSGQWIGGLFIG